MSELTAEESKWLKKVQRVLNECPSKRLGFYTIGDADVFVFDKTNEADFDKNVDFCQATSKEDADLFILKFPSGVYSTAG